MCGVLFAHTTCRQPGSPLFNFDLCLHAGAYLDYRNQALNFPQTNARQMTVLQTLFSESPLWQWIQNCVSYQSRWNRSHSRERVKQSRPPDLTIISTKVNLTFFSLSLSLLWGTSQPPDPSLGTPEPGSKLLSDARLSLSLSCSLSPPLKWVVRWAFRGGVHCCNPPTLALSWNML